jgi:lysophospholipase L1-like esterase
VPHRVTTWVSAGLFVFGLLAVDRVEAAATVSIMPLGDSITVGVGDGTNGGYRGNLYQRLTNAGYSINFVGSQTGGSIPDPNHEGHSGWRADQIRDNIHTWLTTSPADIVLLHIGTNDITQGEHASGITAEIAQILDIIAACEYANHPITVVLARIINRSNPQDALGLETTALNASIASLAATRIAAGAHLVLVDQESALSYPADLVDTVHPNASGYGKMAAVWFEALRPLFDNKGDFVSDTLPTTMIPGVSYDCSVTMHNSGYQPWLCWPTGTMLTVRQSGGPVANQLIPYPYYPIYTNPCRIEMEQDCVFPFTINVPANTPLGSYEISWQMKDEEEWFDSNGHNAVFRKSVTVRLHQVYRGDFDDDGDVDQEDFGHLQLCFSSTGVIPPGSTCSDTDVDGDGFLNSIDLAIFQGCQRGPNVPGDASCIIY